MVDKFLIKLSFNSLIFTFKVKVNNDGNGKTEITFHKVEDPKNLKPSIFNYTVEQIDNIKSGNSIVIFRNHGLSSH